MNPTPSFPIDLDASTSAPAQSPSVSAFSRHPEDQNVDFPYMAIKIFSDFGNVAGKPLSARGVEALRPFWERIEELVAGGELNVALARRCTLAAARSARELARDSATLDGWHVSEAVRQVRTEAQGLAGVLCR
jgi:hypothetical protein